MIEVIGLADPAGVGPVHHVQHLAYVERDGDIGKPEELFISNYRRVEPKLRISAYKFFWCVYLVGKIASTGNSKFQSTSRMVLLSLWRRKMSRNGQFHRSPYDTE